MAATVLCTLLIPAVGSGAGPRDKLRDTKEQLGALRTKIQGHASEAGTLKDRVDSLNRTITKLHIEMNRLDTKVQRVKGEVRTAQMRIDATQLEIDKIEDLATDQAVALYKSGGADTLNALLESESISQLTARVEMLDVAARENTGALIEFGRLRQTIEAQSQALFDKKAELEAELAKRRTLESRLDEQRSLLAKDLAKLNEKLGTERDRERHLESVEEDIQFVILQAQVETDVAALGKSSRGFIWPINGGVTSGYGPRWGTMHTGVDIDGYSGQPIVATKSGTIIFASSSMSGYGNTIIMDHGGGVSTLYAHMSDYELTSGSVRQGKIIGYVGCTGHCYGDHLHFEVRINGNPADPMSYLP